MRTLERGAHLRRNLRGFPRCALFENGAHLRITCAPSKTDFGLPILDCAAIETPKPILDFRFWILDCAGIETPDPPNPGPPSPPAAGRQFGHPKRITVAIRGLRRERFSQSKIQNLKSPPIKKAVPGSLIQARLRVCEIYSLWLYSISSFVSLIIRDEVDPFNSKIL